MKHNTLFWLAFLALAVLTNPLSAQWESHESVLSEHTWYKIGVTEDGIYAVDYAQMQAMGIDMGSLNPNQIRLFGNTPGVLPEENNAERYDDLVEIPVQVTGADDGSFDEQDRMLFYGKGPVNWSLNVLNSFTYEPNPYTDTVYYFLCVDSGENGLRIQDNDQVETNAESVVVNTYLDYFFHESEELSPYNSGRSWFGDLITSQEGSLEFVYDLPGIDTTKRHRIDSKVMGRCSSSFSYSLKINDLSIVSQYAIPKPGSHYYGKEHRTTKTFMIRDEQLVVRYELDSTGGNPMLFNDYFVINFWRKLQYRGQGMAFRVILSQMTDTVARVELDSIVDGVECWEVTNPVSPNRQPLDYESEVASFGVRNGMVRQFFLFESSAAKSVASCCRISNQNLHGITDAEMLIVTPRVFWDQAEELAEFHRDRDSMNCVVVDIREVFNEFAAGVADPTALRDFIRMVYLRSEGNLKYVLLMGKGTHDYRDLKGIHNNFVPTYEIGGNELDEVGSMCSDDYFALMDEYEGKNCTGYVDLGMGRIPVTTPEQAQGVVAKIKHYADLSKTHGIWKNNHLFMADNDVRLYAEHAEKLDYILDTSRRVAMTKKLYLDSYKIISTPSGSRIPEAHADLMDYFDKGVAVLSYTGHGGMKSLSEEWVLSITDIPVLNNYDKLPFVHTATCEFSKFDNPTVVSGGEQMLMNPHGGAIALLTTMRPTTAPNNLELSKSLHIHLFEKDDYQSLRFGDIYRLAKSDAKYYKKANLVYVLFGDPALRFSYPTQEIRTEKVNGMLVSNDSLVTINESWSTIEGYISGVDSEIDTMFNGVVDVVVYDKKTDYTTLGNFDYTFEYSYHHDVIFEGKASVKAGRFTLEFPVPADVNQGWGNACVSYYAYDPIRNVDANGVFDRLVVRVDDPSVIDDDQGPEIKMYWNDPSFENEAVVIRRGVLYADLFDESGIYHYNVSIGRDLVLNSNIPEYDNLIVNAWYEPAVDDSRRGRFVFPVKDLDDGYYQFKLKAWDTRNNSSEVEIAFQVREGSIIRHVCNYPNPFTEETCFTFDHGDMTDRLSVVIEIYDMFGRQVARLEEKTDAEIGVVNPVCWNGSNLKSGIYVYRITVTTSEGKTRSLYQRMVKQ